MYRVVSLKEHPEEHQVIGKSVPRIDGWEKVTGKAIYAGDIHMGNMLLGGSVYTPVPHCRITSIDVSEAKKIPGVHAVLTAADIPKPQSDADVYFLTDTPKFIGDVIAIIAAETKDALNAAKKAIRYTYEELPSVFTIDEALAEGAPQIRERGVGLVNGIPTKGTRGNVYLETYHPLRKGNVEEGFAQCDVIIEREYETQFVEHAYIEPEAVVVYQDPNEGTYTVHSCSQHCHTARKWLADAMQLPQNRVHHVQRTVGGSFGGKEESVGLLAGRAALLCKATGGRPIRMALSREESIIESAKRHPFKFHYKVGATKDGRILAFKGTQIDNCGAYNGHTPYMNVRAMIHSAGAYDIPNIETDTYGVFTNNIHPGAFRGYSSPQIIFAGEQLMEELAEALHMDVVDLKRINLLHQGGLTATSQRLTSQTILKQMMEDMIKKTDFQAKRAKYTKQSGEYRRGIGLITCYRGAGLGSETIDAGGAWISAQIDGSFLINTGLAENGQGLRTAFSQIAAEASGVRMEDLFFPNGDSIAAPDSGMTVASRGTVMGAQAMRKAGQSMKILLLNSAAEMLKCRPEELDLRLSVIYRNGEPAELTLQELCTYMYYNGYQMQVYQWNIPPKLGADHKTAQGDVFPTYSYGVAVAEVVVDTKTGFVDVEKVTVAHDLGTVINPAVAAGQIYGGIVMGMGFGAMEEVVLKKGYVTTQNFDSYIFPTAMDMPEMDITMYECDDPAGTFGAKSLGEPATEMIGAAVAQAVSNATGVRIRELPTSLERVLLGKNLR